MQKVKCNIIQINKVYNADTNLFTLISNQNLRCFYSKFVTHCITVIRML